MNVQTQLEWSPDLELPGRSRTQEFVSQQDDLFLRIRMTGDARAEIEVNDHLLAEVEGFATATALADIYTHDRELLLAARTAAGETIPPFYHLAVADGGYRIYRCDSPDTAPDKSSRCTPLATAESIGEALNTVAKQVSTPLFPVFADQREIYQGLGPYGMEGLAVAAWVARRQVPLVRLLEEDEYTPLYLAYGKGVDGLCFTVYRLVSREFLAEIRSRHDAEEIGKFPDLRAARAYCQLFHASQHVPEWVEFPTLHGEMAPSGDGHYLLAADAGEFRLSSTGPSEVAFGRFATIRQAQAYATAHRAAQASFAIR